MKLIKNNLGLWLILALVWGIQSCSSVHPFQADQVETDKLYGSLAEDSASAAKMPWQDLFADPLLQDYIARTLANNTDVRLAETNIEIAKQNLRVGIMNQFPTLSANASATYSTPGSPRETYALGFGANWNISASTFFTKRSRRSALQISEVRLKVVRTQLIANVAALYYNLLSLDEQLAITRKSLENNIKIENTMTELQQSGRINSASVVQSRAARYAVEATIPDLEQQIAATENSLCMLIGQKAQHIERSQLAKQVTLPSLTIGRPSDLLVNRPDIALSIYTVEQAYHNYDLARSYIVPSLNIGWNANNSVSDLAELLNPSNFVARFVAQFAAGISDFYNYRSTVKVYKKYREQALLQLQQDLWQAGTEVNNAVNSFRAAERKKVSRAQQIKALEESVSITQELIVYGTANYTEVLTAQEKLLAAQLSSVSDTNRQLIAQVTLYCALGGGNL